MVGLLHSVKKLCHLFFNMVGFTIVWSHCLPVFYLIDISQDSTVKIGTNGIYHIVILAVIKEFSLIRGWVGTDIGYLLFFRKLYFTALYKREVMVCWCNIAWTKFTVDHITTVNMSYHGSETGKHFISISCCWFMALYDRSINIKNKRFFDTIEITF